MQTEKNHVRIYPDNATESLSKPVVSTPPEVASQATINFTTTKKDIIVQQGGVCEGILTLVNGSPFGQPSGTDVRAPELGTKAAQRRGRWNKT